MKILTLLMMISAIAVLGCVPQETPQDIESGPETETGTAGEKIGETDAGSSYETGTWITDFDQAVVLASKLDRYVLINFTGSDWCSWCFRLRDEVFTQPAFLDYAKANLILLKLDFPRKSQLSPAEQKANDALAQRFGVQGFPTIVLVDSKGEEITRTGYQYGGAENYVKHLKELLGES